MVENNTSSEAVYQYYTIVNDSVVDNTKNQNTLLGNCTEDKNKITYLYVEPVSSDVILNSVIIDDEHDINVGEMRSNGMDSHLTNIEFILDDGQINTQNNNCYNEVDDNYTIDLEYIGIGHSAEEELEVATTDHANVNNISLCKDVLPESSKRNENFIKVQLVDGTCAYINQTLWNSLLNNIKQENVPKVPFSKQDKKISCTYSGCDKVYTSTHHLAVHVRNHTGCRPYQCPFLCCEKSFATGYSLKAHLRTHTGEAPYGCKICPKHFKTSGDLQKHIRTHTGEKPFKCPIEGCGRSFTTSNIRKVHVRSHTGERPYACTYPDCKKAFASATNFKNHMRIHSGEKPYKCSVPDCGKCFTEYSSLFKHTAVHKPYKPITCEICNQDFKNESTLRSHKQAIHKIYFTDSTDVQIKRELDVNYIFCNN